MGILTGLLPFLDTYILYVSMLCIVVKAVIAFFLVAFLRISSNISTVTFGSKGKGILCFVRICLKDY